MQSFDPLMWHAALDAPGKYETSYKLDLVTPISRSYKDTTISYAEDGTPFHYCINLMHSIGLGTDLKTTKVAISDQIASKEFIDQIFTNVPSDVVLETKSTKFSMVTCKIEETKTHEDLSEAIKSIDWYDDRYLHFLWLQSPDEKYKFEVSGNLGSDGLAITINHGEYLAIIDEEGIPRCVKAIEEFLVSVYNRDSFWKTKNIDSLTRTDSNGIFTQYKLV